MFSKFHLFLELLGESVTHAKILEGQPEWQFFEDLWSLNASPHVHCIN